MDNSVNGLQVNINLNEYRREKVYITIGMGVGYTSKYFLDKEDDNIFEMKRVVSNLIALYIKEFMWIKYNLKVKSKVEANLLAFTIKSKKENVDSVLIDFMNGYFNDGFSNEIAEDVIKKSKEIFKNSYSDIKHRALYKMFESMHFNKTFQLKELIDSFLDVEIRDLEYSKNKLCSTKNTFIHINGPVEEVKWTFLSEIKNIKNTKKILAAFPNVNPSNQVDKYVIFGDTSNYELGNIKLGFADADITYEEQYLITNVLARNFFNDSFEVNTDSIDSSINFTKKYKKNINDFSQIEKKDFNRIKIELLNECLYNLAKKPEEFGRENIRFYFNNSNYLNYLNYLQNIEYGEFKRIQTKADISIVESSVIFSQSEEE